jgi:hypothetical protein
MWKYVLLSCTQEQRSSQPRADVPQEAIELAKRLGVSTSQPIYYGIDEDQPFRVRRGHDLLRKLMMYATAASFCGSVSIRSGILTGNMDMSPNEEVQRNS